MSIAIIGSAGRTPKDLKYLTLNSFKEMVKQTKNIIEKDWKLNAPPLVSGGAAWSDHVAVQLFLEDYCKTLTIHFPCEWDSKNQCFDKYSFCGKTANKLHEQFSKKTGFSSLKQIDMALTKGAKYTVTKEGFLARNTKVAKEAQYMIAFTTSLTNEPTDGGTKDTWDKSEEKKHHVSICTLLQQKLRF